MSDRMALLLLIAVIAFVGLAMRSLRGGALSSGDAEARLVRICNRDPQRAERLIALELRRAPDISRAEAVRRATDRYVRENR